MPDRYFAGLTYPDARAFVGEDDDGRETVIVETSRTWGKSRDAALASVSPDAAKRLVLDLMASLVEIGDDVVTVYRIESTRGRTAGHGPYGAEVDPDAEPRAYEVRSDFYVKVNSYDQSTHPTPDDDGIGWMRTDEYCGFLSLADLRAWFHSGTAESMTTESDGFWVCRAYRVPIREVRKGRRQVTFRRMAAVETFEVDVTTGAEK